MERPVWPTRPEQTKCREGKEVRRADPKLVVAAIPENESAHLPNYREILTVTPNRGGGSGYAMDFAKSSLQ